MRKAEKAFYLYLSQQSASCWRIERKLRQISKRTLKEDLVFLLGFFSTPYRLCGVTERRRRVSFSNSDLILQLHFELLFCSSSSSLHLSGPCKIQYRCSSRVRRVLLEMGLVFWTRDKCLSRTCQKWRLPVAAYQIRQIHFSVRTDELAPAVIIVFVCEDMAFSGDRRNNVLLSCRVCNAHCHITTSPHHLCRHNRGGFILWLDLSGWMHMSFSFS